MSDIIIVRGGGDLATGVIHRLFRCGYRVLVTETQKPTAIRRLVAFSTAVYSGEATVEGVTACLVSGLSQAMELLKSRTAVPLLVDQSCEVIREIHPAALIDAIIAKRGTGTNMTMAPVTIALGPGFEAGRDVNAVIETNRGHSLGRIIWSGYAQANTGTPGVVGGYGKERVIHAPVGGELHIVRDIGSQVDKDEVIAVIGSQEVTATIPGVIRGILPDKFLVWPGLKMADIDPRREQVKNCATISDKARCISGGVLEALMSLGVKP